MSSFKDQESRIQYLKEVSGYHFDPFLKEQPFQILGRFINQEWMTEVKALEEEAKGGKAFGFPDYAIADDDKKTGRQFSDPQIDGVGFSADHIFVNRITEPVITREKVPTLFKMADWFGFAGSIKMKVQIQHPGQVFPVHVDGLKKRVQSKEQEMEMRDHPERWVRVNIQLQDWTWGQMWSVGNSSWQQWRAGEILFHPWWETPHATANGSYVPRYTLQLTGRASAVTFDCIQKQGQLIDLMP